MKRGRRLTRSEKEVVSSHGYNANEWMLYKATEFYLYLVHKTDGRRLTVDKFKKG